MNFDEALKAELSSIPELANKVFPLIAKQKTEAPFCVYKKVNVKYRKTMEGITNKVEGIYNITVISKVYMDLQNTTSIVTDKLLSFFGRYIGDGTGPYIENVTVEHNGDEYELEPELFRADLQLKINY